MIDQIERRLSGGWTTILIADSSALGGADHDLGGSQISEVYSSNCRSKILSVRQLKKLMDSINRVEYHLQELESPIQEAL